MKSSFVQSRKAEQVQSSVSLDRVHTASRLFKMQSGDENVLRGVDILQREEIHRPTEGSKSSELHMTPVRHEDSQWPFVAEIGIAETSAKRCLRSKLCQRG
jgi:hypothetical protein